MKRLSLLLVLAVAGCSSEPSTPVTAPTVAWLDAHAQPLASLDPTADLTDLEPLAAMIGNRRLVGIGEATHGSHEFFTVKHRVLRFLVERMGFTGFAMEATAPELLKLDRYVRTGVGDPAVLLSHQYFWTWNTTEVLALIQWMRAYNASHDSAHQIGFYGIDMQYPAVAIDTVKSFLAAKSPDLGGYIAALYECLTPYKNTDHGIVSLNYVVAPQTVQLKCGQNVAAAYDTLSRSQATVVAATSQGEFDLILHMARIVAQWEATQTTRMTRDSAMAENVEWLFARGSGEKLLVWAHNGHINRNSTTMGAMLARAPPAAYLPIGFSFGSGGLNAVRNSPTGYLGLQAMTAPLAASVVADSYESVLGSARYANYFVDLRAAPSDASAWLGGPHRLRSIGAVYYPEQPAVWFNSIKLPEAYDVLIWISTTTPSGLLPFKF